MSTYNILKVVTKKGFSRYVEKSPRVGMFQLTSLIDHAAHYTSFATACNVRDDALQQFFKVNIIRC